MGATNLGQIGALLRREGLYSSQLTDWRREREAGQLQRLAPQKRGRPHDEQAAELASLRQENERLKAQLAPGRSDYCCPKKTCTSLRANVDAEQGNAIMMATVETLAQSMPVRQACAVLGFPRSSLYRSRQPKPLVEKPSHPTPTRALSPTERTVVRDLLDSERFVDSSPYEVYATLLDEGTYHCSISTMYRILQEYGEVQERRKQQRHPAYTKPELLATEPNQVWSWDITKLRGPAKWHYYYLIHHARYL